MNLNRLKNLYNYSPRVVKKIYATFPWELRMGKEYRKTYKFLIKSINWSKDQWFEYQTNNLKDLFSYCNDSIPFYKDEFKMYEINIEARDIWSEFYKLPFLDKKKVTKNIKKLIPTRSINTYNATTGGTTGKPMQIFYESDSFGREWAYKMFFWNRAIGYKPTDKKATFRGVSAKGKLFIENPIYNEIRFSPFNLEGKNLERIVSKLLEYNPKYIHGYPSAIEKIAIYILHNKINLPDIKGVILISENIYEHQKKRIESAFRTKVYSFYGHSERLVFASMLHDLDIYYAHPAYGITELIDSNQIPITQPNTSGEIVGTGFINKAMPLLRYKTGDFSSWSDTKSDINMPKLNHIQGRWTQEYLIGRHGKKISMTALNMHSEVYTRIKQLQYVQTQTGDVTLKIVKENSFSDKDEQVIMEEHREKLGEEFELRVSYVDALEKTPAGKTKYLIQKCH